MAARPTGIPYVPACLVGGGWGRSSRVDPDADHRALALTIAADASQADGLLRMVEHGVHRLVVVNHQGRPIGVLRAVDLAGVEVRDPHAGAPDLADAIRAVPGPVASWSTCDAAGSPSKRRERGQPYVQPIAVRPDRRRR